MVDLTKSKRESLPFVETKLTGRSLLNNPKLNKGCAFTEEERKAFHLKGLLPYQIESLEQQAARMYVQYHEHLTNLGKNIYLNVLHDYNETLFYKLVAQHLEEMLPVLYTPTVGEAVQRFSLEHRKSRGLYISYPEFHRMEEILENSIPAHVDLTVVTDGEAVLGIGDQGIGGINISSAKLMVYTLCGGINPHRVLPIQLDVGTNNLNLLNDPMYLGYRHERIQGQAYDDFIDKFVSLLIKKFPHIYVHWEDFGKDNARAILNRYRDKICTLNGDIQTTGVVALASVLNAVKASRIPLEDHKIVIFGAGAAGIGIAEQIQRAMQTLNTSLDSETARSQFWLIDKPGLLTQETALLSFQKSYARCEDLSHWQLRQANCIGLYDVVKNVKPTILIGCSTVSQAFTEEIVKLMSQQVARPIIMPLSNPTHLSEAIPEDLIKWSAGEALVATGSPFPDVLFANRRYRIAQSNNALAFPGIGLGAIAVKAKRITDGMLWAATKALAASALIEEDAYASLLPKLSEAKKISMRVALAVAKQACEEGVAQSAVSTLSEIIEQTMWEPVYYPYRKAI